MKTLFLVCAFLLTPLSVFAEILPRESYDFHLFYIGGEYIVQPVLKYFSPKADASERPLIEVIRNYIVALSQEKEIDSARVLKIAKCESNFNPNAYNAKDTDGLPAYGIFQFKKATWQMAGGKDIWDWKEQTEIATDMMADGLWKKWPTCSRI